MGKPPRKRPPVRAAGLVGRLIASKSPEAPESYRRWDDGRRPRSIVVIGDLQRTVLAEQLFLLRRQNDAVREALVRAVSAEDPDVLLLLGDQVADGASDREWYYFDALMRELRDRETAVHALLGNHDYSRFDRVRSERNFFGRFAAQAPGLPETVRFGDIVYVGLDSNFAMLGPERTAAQASAYENLLRELDSDPTVRGVIVASHHPPYSNSSLRATGPVLEYYASPFLVSRKARLYLSAHVHSYERFEHEGKVFVVSGGGGGPRRRVDTSEARRWRNDVFRGAPVRPFHYLRLSLDDNAITAETKMLVDGSFEVGDRFEIELRVES
jgi:Icc-related predicted phosphoesterase